jgi:hypothetical protein
MLVTLDLSERQLTALLRQSGAEKLTARPSAARLTPSTPNTRLTARRRAADRVAARVGALIDGTP